MVLSLVLPDAAASDFGNFFHMVKEGRLSVKEYLAARGARQPGGKKVQMARSLHFNKISLGESKRTIWGGKNGRKTSP
ncbi:MAG: hypothetical protein A2Z73_05155 [Deltaproteobacteria bacterium RBG_13_60_28]|nr:MAG: hypothetical protein A2Z73_05155 [Deltaproteobacteria bacterium RBG_13_60_28]